MEEPGPVEGKPSAGGGPDADARFVPPPPAYAPTVGRRSWALRFRALSGRQRVLLFGGIGTLVLALVAGLLAWVGSGSSGSDDAKARRNLKPFHQAVAGLANASGLTYQDTSAFGITDNEITVTAGGSQFGTTSSGNKKTDRDVLRIGGKTFLRWQDDPAPAQDAEPGTEKPSEWMVGLDDGSELVDEALSRTPAPAELAAVLSKSLAELEETPQPANDTQQPLTVGGKPALGVDTSAGRLLVTEQEPHRVLRLEPYDVSDALDRLRDGKTPTEIPKVTTGPLAGGDSDGMDLTPIVGAAIDAMFDTLLKYADQLKDASDHGINFTLDGSGDMNCGSSGCSVVQNFTGQVSSTAREERVTKGEVTAILSATFSIGGQSAGQCTSPRGTFPITGNSVSGTLRCSNPGAGSVYSSVAARYKAQAEAESRASGGRTVRYTIPLRANTLIDARALAAVEAKQLVEGAQRERDTAHCVKPHSFPSGTLVLLADGTRRAIEDIRVGDRVTATDPEQRLTAARPVTHVITTEADKDFVRLTTAAGTVTTTGTHPFWLVDERRWADADDLTAGDLLRLPSGAALPVVSVAHFTRRETTHDLTVAGLHSYYVGVGSSSVLVHNTPPGPCSITTPKDAPTINSKTVFKAKDNSFRVDIENQSPGKPGAGIHLQFMGRGADPTKYYYNPTNGSWVSETGKQLSSKTARQVPRSAITKAYQYFDMEAP
ncbi:MULTISPECIES: Hint domain-containing protein [unclassified Streptomyces]|uniref:Hint domain-containing protein n=1 Tax=unclassified Streptomyces TaxID=2593676 RepID=UPI0036E34C8C